MPSGTAQDGAQLDQDFLADAVLGPLSDSDVSLTLNGWGVYWGGGVFCFGMREDGTSIRPVSLLNAAI